MLLSLTFVAFVAFGPRQKGLKTKDAWVAQNKKTTSESQQMEVEVNTGETEIEDVGVHTVRPDEKEIIVDTMVEDALDGVVEDGPMPQKPVAPIPAVVKQKPLPMAQPQIAASVPVPERTQQRAPSPVMPDKRPKHRHHHAPEPRKKTPPPQEAEAADNVFDAIDDNPQFARAMRSTLPKGPPPAEEWDSSEASYSTTEEEVPKPKKRQRAAASKSESESEKKDEADWSEYSAYGDDVSKHTPKPSYDSEADDASSVGTSEPKSDGEESTTGSEASVDEEQTKEDEYIEKMKIIEQIKDYAKMGILPPQPPAFSMPISLLRKMRNYMESKADEIMGIGMIGTGWISIIGIIEKLNGQYDPFAKIFGMGLKLTGAKQAVAEKIHLYEAVFKHIYAKLPKSKEMNPWIQFGLVTMQILAEVHVSNMRKEMEAEAEETARNPRTHEDAEHIRKMFEERERQRRAERQTDTIPTLSAEPRKVPPQPMMQPPKDEITDEEEEEEEEPKKTKIDLKQPTPKEETPLKTKEEDSDEEEEVDEVEEKEAEDSDDSDVVVELPAPKRRTTQKTL
jgi:hypothetical protein